MKHCLAFLFLILGSLQAQTMKPFISTHVPMRSDGKIDIPSNIKHIKLDIGLSYNAPMSQYWLSHENDLLVFGFEPNLTAVESIKKGAVKQNPSHGDPLDTKYLGTRFFVIPCALGLQSGKSMDFYITKKDCGCSSLYRPTSFEVEQIVQIPVFRLSDFFDLLPLDTHPIIDYIKIDAQGSDLDIVKSAGHYLQDHVVYITIEAENTQYANTINSAEAIDRYMRDCGFVKDLSHSTSDPTYFNPRFRDYVRKNKVTIFQRG